jgi:hypothetical protein
VFQPPQEGHLPSHLELSKPQDWQTKLVLGLSLVFRSFPLSLVQRGWMLDETESRQDRLHWEVLRFHFGPYL